MAFITQGLSSNTQRAILTEGGISGLVQASLVLCPIRLTVARSPAPQLDVAPLPLPQPGLLLIPLPGFEITRSPAPQLDATNFPLPLLATWQGVDLLPQLTTMVQPYPTVQFAKFANPQLIVNGMQPPAPGLTLSLLPQARLVATVTPNPTLEHYCCGCNDNPTG